MNKLRFAIGAAITVAVVAGVAFYDNYINPATAKDCSNNAVVKCGVWSVKEMQQRYNSNSTPGTQNIFAGMGITSDMVNGKGFNIVEGTVMKNGNVVYKNEVVATGASSAGRQGFGNPNRIKKSYGGTVYYEASTQHSFLTNSLAAYLIFDLNGNFKGAVIKDCGNPVRAIPKPPAPKPTPAAACTGLTASNIKRADESENVTLTATASVNNGATISKYTFTITDASGKVVATVPVNSTATTATAKATIKAAGTYTVKVVVTTSTGEKTASACQTKFTIPEPPKPAPQPVYTCNELKVEEISRDHFKFSIKYTAINGAVYKKTIYKVYDASGKEVYSTESGEFKGFEPGNYTVKAFIVVTVNNKEETVTSANCEVKVTIDTPPAPKTPAVKITKTVNGVEKAVVAINEQFTYELVVKNTGEVDLTNVAVIDPAPEGVQFKAADKGAIADNKWSYTIPSLKVGESQTFKITAVVTKEIASATKNTACVDTPTVPGSPDDCDDAYITTKVKVCEISTKKIVEVTPEEAKDTSRYDGVDSEKCKEQPEVPSVPETPTPETPNELPKTGLLTDVMSIMGLGALAAASTAYVASRRNS